MARIVLFQQSTWIALMIASVARAVEPTPPPLLDDLLFRPTVIVIRGTSQGSGTVIASSPGETLVLTAAHVLESDAEPFIEVHRYNLGLERRRRPEGWPKKIPAKVVAIDSASDVAVLKIAGFQAMPYVATVAPGPAEAEPETVVTSVGIDRGAKLSSWRTRVIDFAAIDMKKKAGGGDRPFVLTEKPPDFGRSGGGLFRDDGTVVGVCVGRAEVIRGRRVGIFASNTSIHRLLRENALETSVARSLARRLPRSSPIERTRGVVPAPPAPEPR